MSYISKTNIPITLNAVSVIEMVFCYKQLYLQL